MLKNPDTQEDLLARIKVPKILPRFLCLPEKSQIEEKVKTINWTGVPLEQVIAHNLGTLFPGMDIQEYHLFRVTRDADLGVQEDESDDLLLVIEKELRKRRIGGTVVRMEINPTMPSKLKRMLMENL